MEDVANLVEARDCDPLVVVVVQVVRGEDASQTGTAATAMNTRNHDGAETAGRGAIWFDVT